MPAYACKVTEQNLSVIASEAGKGHDRELTRQWLEEHREGFFLRDPSSVLDCQLFVPAVFFEMYMFENGDTDALFRRVVKI